MPFELYEAALRLDGPTLQNLNILDCDGKNEGSLLAYLDTCASAGGYLNPFPHFIMLFYLPGHSPINCNTKPQGFEYSSLSRWHRFYLTSCTSLSDHLSPANRFIIQSLHEPANSCYFIGSISHLNSKDEGFLFCYTHIKPR